MPRHSSEPPPVAYSYIRFSSPQQAEGDSLRRQTAKTEEWCRRNNVRLDTSVSLRDAGVSAFRGRHRDDKNALGSFLKLVERGRVSRGSFLIIENLDRLSREDERKALRLWMDILDAGINIVQLTPETIFRHEKSDMIDVMRAIIELSRGHSESRIKSDRLSEVWGERKRRARENGDTLTQNLPGWIEERGGKRCIKAGAKETIKRAFQLAGRGYGEVRIMRLFTKEGVPSFGTSGRWTKPYIHSLLKDRRLLGEFQPTLLATGEPDGPVIMGYFPRVLEDAEFYAARRGRLHKNVRIDHTPVELQSIDELYAQGKTVAEISRRVGASRQSIYRALIRLERRKKTKSEDKCRPVYLFAGGMVQVYGSKQSYNLATWRKGDGYSKALVLDRGRESFPYFVFESALLHELNEIDPKEVLGENGHGALKALEDEYNAIRGEIDSINDFMDVQGFSDTLGMRAKKLDERLRGVSAKLKIAADKAANPLSAAWAEAKGIVTALDKAADKEDAKLRLRASLRRIIARIEMAILTGKKQKLALVEIEFAGEHAGRFRSLTIWYRRGYGNATFNRPGKWAVESAAGQGKPIEYIPSEEPGEPPIPVPSEWVKQLPAEPKDWFPLPD